MPDRRRENLSGSGVERFSVDGLSSGDKQVFNLRELEVDGNKGWFRPYLPLDAITVINTSSETLEVTMNDKVFIVAANSTKSVTEQRFTYIEVLNDGGSATSSGEVFIELEATPFDADDAARQKARQGPIESVIENFTGLGGV